MKICVLIARYALSGVALAQVRFAEALHRRGHDVDLIIGQIDTDFDILDVSGVNVIHLKAKSVRQMAPALWRYFRVKQPDVAFSAEDHLNIVTILSARLARSKSKISGSSRITPNDAYSSRILSKKGFMKQVMKVVMHQADALTCVTTGMVEQYKVHFRNPPHVCVYNIVGDPRSRAKMNEPLEHPWFDGSVPTIVAAGALAPWKGFADLIQAMKIVTQRRAVRLVILGDGPLRADLQSLIKALDLERFVRLEGFVKNPLKYYKKSKVFVLSSYLEGMPNVLLEAMMCGCTPVSTDCPTGPREALLDGRYGTLVEVGDTAALAEGILYALDNPLAEHLLIESVKRFDETTIIDQHFRALGIDDQKQ